MASVNAIDEIKFTPVNTSARKELNLRAGDTVKVWLKILEKGKTRLQSFEGIVLACKHGKESGATFTVRKIASGVGVEKVFPLFSPMIDKIDIIKRAKVRRSKLYYIREKTSRQLRKKLRKSTIVKKSTEDYEKALEDSEKVIATEKAEEQAKVDAEKAKETDLREAEKAKASEQEKAAKEEAIEKNKPEAEKKDEDKKEG